MGGMGTECGLSPRPDLAPLLTVRCCWDLCPPSLFSCRNTRPTHTSSCGPAGVWRPLGVREDNKFYSLKTQAFL